MLSCLGATAFDKDSAKTGKVVWMPSIMANVNTVSGCNWRHLHNLSTVLTDFLSRVLLALGGVPECQKESKWSRPKLIGPMKPLFWPPFWSSDSDSNFNSSPFSSSSENSKNIIFVLKLVRLLISELLVENLNQVLFVLFLTEIYYVIYNFTFINFLVFLVISFSLSNSTNLNSTYDIVYTYMNTVSS